MGQKGTDFENVQTNAGSRRQRADEKVPILKFTERKWKELRLVGSLYTYGYYTVKTKNKEGKVVAFNIPAPSYDPETQQLDSSKFDPWRDLMNSQADVDRNDKLVTFTRKGWINAIDRKSQSNEPSKKPKLTSAERKSGFKDQDSDSWTPMVPVRLPPSAMGKIKDQADLNTRKIKGQTKSFPVTHAKFGCDIRVMYDSTKSPADQYSVVIGEKSELTEDELAYLQWDLSDLETPLTDAETKREFESWARRNGVKIKAKKSKEEDDSDDDEDDDEQAPKSKKKVVRKSDPDDEDDDSDEDDETKSKKKPIKKSKPADDDDDFDDDEEEESDDDEDDEPAPKSKKKVVAKKKSKSDDDEDDDFDEDEDDSDDDEEDDEPTPKSKKKPVTKSKKSDPDEDDDDFDDDSDDEDDDKPAPKSKKKPVVKAKPPVKKKKPVDDDDDDDDDDFDEDEESDDDEEDDEPAPKSKKKVVKKPVTKKKPVKKSKDEDDDDFDDEEDDEDD